MKGYVAHKGNRWYAVVYEGVDPVTGRERRRWHPASVERADAKRLAARLAKDLEGRNDKVRALTFGAYLTTRWLPGKRIVLADSTYASYRRNVELHVLPTLGRVPLRHLGPRHLEALYDHLLRPGEAIHVLSPKTVYEIHLVIRGALADAVRRGLVSRNVALVAHAPRLRSIPKLEQHAWTAAELHQFLRAAAGHRHFPALWVLAFTGMRRNELLGLRWDDYDPHAATLSINRGLVAVGYDLHETRERPRTPAVASISTPPPSTCSPPASVGRPPRNTPQGSTAAGGCSPTRGRTNPPHALSQSFERIARRARVRIIRLHDLRHTHGTLLIAAGVPVKVVSERLGHAMSAFTIETYQHVLPGMQAGAARTFEHLVLDALPDDDTSEKNR